MTTLEHTIHTKISPDLDGVCLLEVELEMRAEEMLRREFVIPDPSGGGSSDEAFLERYEHARNTARAKRELEIPPQQQQPMGQEFVEEPFQLSLADVGVPVFRFTNEYLYRHGEPTSRARTEEKEEEDGRKDSGYAMVGSPDGKGRVRVSRAYSAPPSIRRGVCPSSPMVI